MNDRLKDFIECSKYAFKETFGKIRKSYILFLFVLLQAIFQSVKSGGFLGGSYVSSLILYLVDVVIYCFIAQALRSLVIYGNSGKKSVDSSLGNFFYLVLSAMFSVYVIELLVGAISRTLPSEINFIIVIIMKFLLSAVMEFVYIQQYYGFDIVLQSARFVTNNLLIWGVYSLIYVILQLYLQRHIGAYASSQISEGVNILLLTVCDTLFMLVKGHLFKILNGHSYRQRKFMRG